MFKIFRFSSTNWRKSNKFLKNAWTILNYNTFIITHAIYEATNVNIRISWHRGCMRAQHILSKRNFCFIDIRICVSVFLDLPRTYWNESEISFGVYGVHHTRSHLSLWKNQSIYREGESWLLCQRKAFYNSQIEKRKSLTLHLIKIDEVIKVVSDFLWQWFKFRVFYFFFFTKRNIPFPLYEHFIICWYLR